MAASKHLVVLLEGSIGAGKSTFLNLFRNLEDYSIDDEPLHQWRNVEGSNLLVSPST
jgi:dephospho-CoA kinase